jgi:hypothetical protein
MMGLNKKALKLAAYKRCGLGAKHLFKSITSLTRAPRGTEGSFLYVKAHLVPLVKTQWKHGKFPQRPSLYRYDVDEANLLTGVVPKSADPVVKEVDANTNELTIEFTAIKSGYEVINREMAEGLPIGSFPTITPQPSALRNALARMHVASIATGLDKLRGKV